MANYINLKNAIEAAIKPNASMEITGDVLQQVLLSTVSALGAGSQYVGIATPSLLPGTSDSNLLYIATEPGTYSGFGGYQLSTGAVIFINRSGTWAANPIDVTTMATARQIAAGGNASKYHTTGAVTIQAAGGDPVAAYASDNKFLRVPVTEGAEYMWWTVAPSYGNTLNCFIGSDGKKLQANFKTSNGLNRFTAPTGAAEVAMQMEYTPSGEAKWGDASQCCLLEVTPWVEYVLSLSTEIAALRDDLSKLRPADYQSINLCSATQYAGGDVADSGASLTLHNVTIQSAQYYSDSRFNLKGLRMVANPTYRFQNYPNFKAFRSDFVGFDFGKKIDLTIAGGGLMTNTSGEQKTVQMFITVYYGTEADVRNANEFHTDTAAKYITYTNYRIISGAAVTNNTDKSFGVTTGGNFGVTGVLSCKIPLYPTIKDGTGNDLPFAGIVVSLIDDSSATLTTPMTYSFFPVAIKYGAASISGTQEYPLSLAEGSSLVTTDMILDGSGKIKSDLIPTDVESGEVINAATSDKIAFYGCSYTESYYAVKNKSWINKLSNLLDIQLANFGVSGNRLVEEAQRLRKDSNPYGTVGIKAMKPTYIAVQNIGNETLMQISAGSMALYMKEIDDMCEAAKAIGATPILGTDHLVINPVVDAALKQYADDHGYLYCPIGSISAKVLQTHYAPFWGGEHPGTRTNESTVQEWWHMLKDLPVRKALKVFRFRDTFTADNIQSLNYHSTAERLQRFVEINVGEKALAEDGTSPRYYDDLQDRSKYTSVVNANEYATLIAGGDVDFSEYALIEVISSRVRCSRATVTMRGTAGLKFYAILPNDPAEPYSIDRENCMFQVTKAVYDAFTDAVGTAYTSSATGSTTITYAGKFAGTEYGGYFLNFAGASATTTAAGTLTRSGKTVQYSAADTMLGRYTAGFYAAEQIGTVVAVDAAYANGVYTLDLSGSQYWSTDKLRLIVSAEDIDDAFTLGAIESTVYGGEEKPQRVTHPRIKTAGEELTTDTGFGGASWNGQWTKDSGITFEQLPAAIRDYPAFNDYASNVVLTEQAEGFANKITKTFTVPTSRGYRRLIIKTAARLFPKIYNQTTNDATHTTTRQIFPQSYDYGRMIVGAKFDGKYVASSGESLVGVGWAEHQVELLVPPYTTTIAVEVYRHPGDFEQMWTLSHTWPMQVSDISVSITNDL